VALRIELRAQQAVVHIRDHGPGVPPASLGRIFEPFFCVAQARDRDSGGYGIGLAITARVAALHGGSVCARNAAGGGLEVELRLPLRRADG
jgi:two-component system sensor histidine kinase CpxA